MPEASMSEPRVWTGAVMVHLPSTFLSDVTSPVSFLTVNSSMLSEAMPGKSLSTAALESSAFEA